MVIMRIDQEPLIWLPMATQRILGDHITEVHVPILDVATICRQETLAGGGRRHPLPATST
jgi:hypothetical protein